MLERKDEACGGCPLQTLGGMYRKLPSGTGTTGVMLVLDWDLPEAKMNSAGMALLERILLRIPEKYTGRKLTLSDFRVTQLVSCTCDEDVLHKQKETRHIFQCRRYFLDQEIKSFKPKAMVVFGKNVLQAFSGETNIDYLRGYQFFLDIGGRRIPYVPTFHPRIVVKGKLQFAEVIQLDILKALHIAENGPYRLDGEYLCDPPMPKLEEFVKAFEAEPPDTPLSFDIETPYADKDEITEDQGDVDASLVGLDSSYQILRISFAFKSKQAVSFPWQFPFTGVAKRLLSSPNPKITWNGDAFDIPRLEANDCPVEGDSIDGMHLWHFFKPSLPMGLKFAGNFFCPEVPAWSLESNSNPALYNALDSDVALRACLAIIAKLKEEGRWETFQTDFIELSRYLRLMHQRGVKVDVAQRDLFTKELEHDAGAMLEDIQNFVPLALKPKKVWKSSKAALIRDGKWKDSFIIIKEEATLKPNQELDEEGFIRTKSKPKKEKRAKKGPKQTSLEGTDPKPLKIPKPRKKKEVDPLASKPVRRSRKLQTHILPADASLPTQQGLFDSTGPQDSPTDNE